MDKKPAPHGKQTPQAKQTTQTKLTQQAKQETHEKHKAGSHDQQLRQSKGSWAPILIPTAGAIVIAGAVAAYFLFFSPTAQFKRAYNGAASAFEQKKSAELSKFISDTYSDEGGNSKTSLLTAAEKLYDSYDKITVKTKRLDVKLIDGKKAELTVEGSVYFKTGKETYLYKPDQPVVFYMSKEPDGGRRLTTIQGLKFELQSITNEIDSLK